MGTPGPTAAIALSAPKRIRFVEPIPLPRRMVVARPYETVGVPSRRPPPGAGGAPETAGTNGTGAAPDSPDDDADSIIILYDASLRAEDGVAGAHGRAQASGSDSGDASGRPPLPGQNGAGAPVIYRPLTMLLTDLENAATERFGALPPAGKRAVDVRLDHPRLQVAKAPSYHEDSDVIDSPNYLGLVGPQSAPLESPTPLPFAVPQPRSAGSGLPISLTFRPPERPPAPTPSVSALHADPATPERDGRNASTTLTPPSAESGGTAVSPVSPIALLASAKGIGGDPTEFALTMKKADPLVTKAFKESAGFEELGLKELERMQNEIRNLEADLKADQNALVKEKK